MLWYNIDDNKPRLNAVEESNRNLIDCLFFFLIFFKIFLHNIEILLLSNLCIYVYEIHFYKLELWLLPPTLHKYLYLWSDHCTKGMRYS